MLVKISSLEVLEELLDGSWAEVVTTVTELLEITTSWVDDPHLWEVTGDSDVISKPLVETVSDSGGRHKDVTLEFGGSFGEGLSGGFTG